MKRGVRILICFAGMVAWAASARADGFTMPPGTRMTPAQIAVLRHNMLLRERFNASKRPGMQPPMNRPPSSVPAGNSQLDNPYVSIVTRNVFGLNPPPPPTPPDQQDTTPPPKITLTGITTIFGPAEALYRVAGGNRDGKQWQDESYILQEGQEQDEVAIVAIDPQKDIVTFNNHGVVQTIPLSAGVASGGGGDSGPSGPGPIYGQPRFGGFGRPPNFDNLPPNIRQRLQQAIQQRLGNDNGDSPTVPDNTQMQPSYNTDNGNNNNVPSSQSVISQLSPDDKMALIAAQHAQLQQQGSPTAALFPPTPYDDQANQEASGAAGSSGDNSSAPPAP